MTKHFKNPVWKIGILGALMAAFTINTKAETLAWEKNPESNVIGYKVYYGPLNSTPSKIDVGNVTSHLFSNLVPGTTYSFYITAYNSYGLESDPSAQVNYTKPSGTVNTAPTISTIANLTIVEDSVATATFTVNDAETAASSLIVTATSSNQGLLPNANLTPGGSSSSRTLSVRPAPDQSGSGTVTVTVSDGSATASRSFSVTVSAVNDVPVITDISDRTISANTSTGTIPITISDKETAAGSLTLTALSSNSTLVPQSGLVLGGTGGSRTLNVTPAANQTGQATITLSVSDGVATATDTFLLTVQASGSSQTTTLVENFEGPGYQNAGWVEVRDPNPTYAGIVSEGSYSLATEDGDRVYRVLNGATSADLYLMILWREWTSSHKVLEFTDAAATPVASLQTLNGRLRASHGSAGVSGTSSIALNQRYHVWVEWRKGSGTDGRMAIYLSTTSTKPSTPEAVVNTGNGGIGERLYLGDVPVGAPTVTYDKINLTYSTGSTSTPQSTNQPPTISAIADQVIAEDAAAKTVAFAVNDTTTSPANLIVTAATSNSTLLPSGNLTLGGSGTNRTVSFRPASNQSGTANITVTVSDGQLTSSDTFVVNVTAVNDAPTISNTSDKVISQNSSTGPIPVTIGDVETAAGSLQLTAQSSNTSLVPQSGLVMGGSGANRTVTVTPAANQSGQATITLQVSDGTLVATDTFIVTVQAASTSPSTSQPTYLLAENFEAPGYENPGWFEVGNPDDYYSRVRLEGLYSLRTQLGAQAYRELGGAANAHLSFMFVWRESTANHTILDLSDNTGNPSGFVWATPGQLHLSHGDATVSAPFSYALNTRYYLWVDWAAGTGANGVMSLYISGSSTKPATPLIRITNGNGLPAERIYFGGAAPDSPSIAFDMLKMSDGPLPAN